MRPALIVIDMLNATFEDHRESGIGQAALQIIDPLNQLIDRCHATGAPVIFACDSFLPGDFIFTGKMPPHSLRGTRGAMVTDWLHRAPEDMVLDKRRFSAFFKTDLDQTLRTLGCDTVLITGLATHICVLSTVFDALSNDFRTIIVEDCCAAHKPKLHEPILDTYRKTPLQPLLQVQHSSDCLLLLPDAD